MKTCRYLTSCAKTPRGLTLITILWFSSGGFVWADGLNASPTATPIILSDKQLDGITAGTGTVQLNLNLSAAAEGSLAETTTVGTVNSAETTIFLVKTPPNSPPSGDVRLLGDVPSRVFLATGQATATGTTDADCSGNITTSGEYAYLTEASVRTMPSSPVGLIRTTCSCAVFAIALGSH